MFTNRMERMGEKLPQTLLEKEAPVESMNSAVTHPLHYALNIAIVTGICKHANLLFLILKTNMN